MQGSAGRIPAHGRSPEHHRPAIVSSLRRLPRLSLVLAMAATTLGTSCVTVRGVSLAPSGEHQPESTVPSEEALAIAAGIAELRGLTSTVSEEKERAGESWTCWLDERHGLCAKRTDAQLQFRISNIGQQTTEQSDALLAELTDSLRARYGADRIRACEWRRERDRTRAGTAMRSVCTP